MSNNDKNEIDSVTGVDTTGHEWDGIKELNNPLPSWWLWTFYACIAWALVFSILYPAWPMVTSATKGVLGYTTRGELAKTMEDARAAQAQFVDKIEAMEVSEIANDRGLLAFAVAGGAAAFKTNCSQCHGSGAAGAKGYPNLLDDDWIWGGSTEEIHTTIAHGIRQTDAEGYYTDDTRQNDMPAFGRDELLEKEQIAAVIAHVQKISGQSPDAGADVLAEGALLFEENCASCHGDDGAGMRDLGAPNLTDALWLYGGDVASLKQTMETGRGGMMPAWGERLPDATVKQLALYVHSLGGGE